jgi:hypothetical protein
MCFPFTNGSPFIAFTLTKAAGAWHTKKISFDDYKMF